MAYAVRTCTDFDVQICQAGHFFACHISSLSHTLLLEQESLTLLIFYIYIYLRLKNYLLAYYYWSTSILPFFGFVFAAASSPVLGVLSCFLLESCSFQFFLTSENQSWRLGVLTNHRNLGICYGFLGIAYIQYPGDNTESATVRYYSSIRFGLYGERSSNLRPHCQKVDADHSVIQLICVLFVF